MGKKNKVVGLVVIVYICLLLVLVGYRGRERRYDNVMRFGDFELRMDYGMYFVCVCRLI